MPDKTTKDVPKYGIVSQTLHLTDENDKPFSPFGLILLVMHTERHALQELDRDGVDDRIIAVRITPLIGRSAVQLDMQYAGNVAPDADVDKVFDAFWDRTFKAYEKCCAEANGGKENG